MVEERCICMSKFVPIQPRLGEDALWAHESAADEICSYPLKKRPPSIGIKAVMDRCVECEVDLSVMIHLLGKRP